VFGAERRLEGGQTKRKIPVGVFGALSLVLSLDEQRKNEERKKKEKDALLRHPLYYFIALRMDIKFRAYMNIR